MKLHVSVPDSTIHREPKLNKTRTFTSQWVAHTLYIYTVGYNFSIQRTGSTSQCASKMLYHVKTETEDLTVQNFTLCQTGEGNPHTAHRKLSSLQRTRGQEEECRLMMQDFIWGRLNSSKLRPRWQSYNLWNILITTTSHILNLYPVQIL